MKNHLLAATSVFAVAALSFAAFGEATAKQEYIFRPIPPKPSDFVKPADPAPTTPAVPSGPALSYSGTSATVGYPMTATPSSARTPSSTSTRVSRSDMSMASTVPPGAGVRDPRDCVGGFRPTEA